MLGIRWRKLANGPPRWPHGSAKHRHHRKNGGAFAAHHGRRGLFAGVEGDFLYRDEILAKHGAITVENAVKAGFDQLARILELVDAYRGGKRFAVFARVQAHRSG